VHISNPIEKERLVYHFQKLARGDKEIFTEDLTELSPNRLKDCCAAMDIPMSGDKHEIVKAIVKAVAKEKGEAKLTATATDKPEKGKEEPATATAKVVKLKVNPVYKNLLPRPTAIEKARTKASIEEAFKGGGTLSEKMKVLSDMTVYDGHTRLEILQELKIPITENLIEIVDIPKEQVELEIMKLNVFRRHLTDLEKIASVKKYLPQVLAAAKGKADASAADKKKAEAAAKKAEAAAKKAEEKEKKAKAAEKEKAKKAAEKAKATAAKAKEAAKKAAEKAKADAKAAHTREAIANAAGVAPGQVKLEEWCKKFVPDYLTDERKKGVEIGTIYGVAYGWWKRVKAFSPELLEEVKTGKVKLEDAFFKAQTDAAPDEHIPGPLEACTLDIKALYYKGLEKKYNGDVKPDEHEADFLDRLTAKCAAYAKKNK
jgi:hypothetical protein